VFNYVTAEKAIEELIGILTNRYWGVNAENRLVVYTPNTAVDEVLFQNNSPYYTEVNIKKNWNSIKATRYQVFKKTTGGGSERIGQVGYGAGYDPIDLEKIYRKKEGKEIISTSMSSSEALDFAYSKLTNLEVPISIRVTNVNMDYYIPAIGDYIQVQDEEEKVIRTIIDCDSVTGWTGATIDTADYCEGSASIYFTATSSGNSMYYDFGSLKKWRYPSRLGFMIKGTVVGEYLEWSYSNDSSTLWDNAKNIKIDSANVWEYTDYSHTDNFRYIGIRCTSSPTSPSDINIDQVCLFSGYREIYENNIKQINFKISEFNDRLCHFTAGQYEQQISEEEQELRFKVENIETISYST